MQLVLLLTFLLHIGPNFLRIHILLSIAFASNVSSGQGWRLTLYTCRLSHTIHAGWLDFFFRFLFTLSLLGLERGIVPTKQFCMSELFSSISFNSTRRCEWLNA